MIKGVSLHVGIDRLSLLAYEKEGLLRSPVNDAGAMAGIARAEGFEDVTVLTGEQATKQQFLDHLDASIPKLNAGDTFLLTFSGHGGQIDDDSRDEADGMDETWCFYDGHLVDDEIGKRWSRFRSGVKVVVISASCHSGTALRVLTPGCFSGSCVFGKKEIVQNNRSILSAYLSDPSIQASILHISACEDQQEATDGNELSLFTKLLITHWDEGRFTGNYEDLVRSIRNQSGYLHRAGIALLGNRNEDFLESKPFKLLTTKT